MKIQRGFGIKIIDAHAHVGPVYNFFVPFNDGHGMVKSMDLLGIETTVISSNAAITADVCFGNQYTHEVIKQHPGRFLGYFVVNPHYPEKMGEDISRYFSIDEFVGIKIHPELSGDYPMTGKGYVSMWEFAERNRVPVLTHTYFGGDRLEVIEMIAKEYPNAPLLIGHGGADLGLGKAIDMVNGQKNLYLDLCSPVNKVPGALRLVAKECDPDKALFATDSPWNDPNLSVGAVVFADVEESMKKKWLRSNFLNLFTRAVKFFST